MAIFRWEDDNLGFHRYDDLEQYDVDETTSFDDMAPWPANLSVVFEFLSDDEPFDEEEYAFSFVLEASGVTSVEIEEGDDAGYYRPISGTIDSLTYYNMNGEVILTITDVNVPVAWAASLDTDDFNNIFDFIQGQDNTYVGATNGPSDTWDDFDDYDSIETGSGDDDVRGRGGNDYISDGGGADSYNGGGGFHDTLTYDDWYHRPAGMVSGITANLVSGTIIGPDGETDTVVGIENVFGTWMDDSFTGNSRDNFFRGYQGDDVFDGGTGFDTVDYSRDARYGGLDGARVNLATGTGTDGFGNTDTYTNIEAVRGTDIRDRLRDDDGDNYLRGEEGNDLLMVRRGDDSMRGDEGADEFRFLANNFGDNYIHDFNVDEGDFITINNANAFSDLTLVQDGGSVIVTFRSSSIQLNNVDLADLDASDFGF